MPLGRNVRFRVHTTESGKKIRLAFRDGQVLEAKNLETGATHTAAEFQADRAAEGRTIMTGRRRKKRGY